MPGTDSPEIGVNDGLDPRRTTPTANPDDFTDFFGDEPTLDVPRDRFRGALEGLLPRQGTFTKVETENLSRAVFLCLTPLSKIVSNSGASRTVTRIEGKNIHVSHDQTGRSEVLTVNQLANSCSNIDHVVIFNE